MSSKLIDRSVGKYLLSFAILNLIMPLVAFAGTSNGNIGISLQVVPKCNIPNVSNTGLSQAKDITQHLDIKCSAQAKPAEVKVFTVPATPQSLNKTLEHQNDSVNILVSY
jgi:hypothetical protein